MYIQSTLVSSTLLISNNRLSRSKILVPVLTWKSKKKVTKYCGKEEKLLLRAISPLFHNIFNRALTSGVKLHIHLLNVVVRFIVFLTSATLIFRGTDISKYYRESLGLRDNESLLYIKTSFQFKSAVMNSWHSGIVVSVTRILSPSGWKQIPLGLVKSSFLLKRILRNSPFFVSWCTL